MQNDEFIIALLLEQWDSKSKQLSALFEQLGEESSHHRVAPDRNKVIYLLGHFVAYNDAMADALAIGSRNFQLYDKVFFAPQSEETAYPPFEELLTNLHTVNQRISDAIRTFSIDDWFSKHTYVNAEDFAAQPHRNKLSILLSRTAHLSHHYGQLLLARQKN